MNSANFDSNFCGNLPLHHINSIQSYGCLLVASKTTLDIIQASENVLEYLGIPVREVVGSNIKTLFVADNKEVTLNVIEESIGNKQLLKVTVNGHSMNVMVHGHENYFLLELETASADGDGTYIDGLQEVRKLMTALEKADNIQEVCDISVHELKRITKFDGVMMYRFDPDWNGTVVSEEKTNGLESYLGVTFPASDVPKQARQLYLTNPYRLIPDRAYTPSRLYPVINPETNTFTNLSTCNLRGVADVHLEYLRNMGVTGSMSLRIIHNDKLWGLVSCNHTTPYYLKVELCLIFELLSNVVSTKISSIINKEEYEFVADLQRQRNLILDQIYRSNDIEEGIFRSNVSLLKLFRASGGVLFHNDKKAISGDVPDDGFLNDLHLWLQAKEIDQVYATHNLSGSFDEASEYRETASGMLVIPFVDSGDTRYYIACFRPEVIKTIEWGGNPHQAINFEENGVNYHPRNSFKIWMEKVNQTSQPWHDQELHVADTVRSLLLEYKSKSFGRKD